MKNERVPSLQLQPSSNLRAGKCLEQSIYLVREIISERKEALKRERKKKEGDGCEVKWVPSRTSHFPLSSSLLSDLPRRSFPISPFLLLRSKASKKQGVGGGEHRWQSWGRAGEELEKQRTERREKKRKT